MLHRAPLPAEMRMTPRARAYLLIAATRHSLIGLACLLSPHSFDGPVYNGIKRAIGFVPAEDAITAWGVLFMSTALLCVLAAVMGREGEARWALLASVATTALLTGGFVASMSSGIRVPTGTVLAGALVLKDLVVLRQPLRSPFEVLTRRVLERQAAEE